MGGGSSEVRALSERLDELEAALEKIKRAWVLRGDRLSRVEKLSNDQEASIEALTDQIGPVDVDLSKLVERVSALEAAAKPTSSRRRDAGAKKAAKPASSKRRDAEAGD